MIFKTTSKVFEHLLRANKTNSDFNGHLEMINKQQLAVDGVKSDTGMSNLATDQACFVIDKAAMHNPAASRFDVARPACRHAKTRPGVIS
jgi:hypothetical protein